MAESQVPFPYGPERLRAIRAAISEPRFAAYMRRAGNQEEYACALYLYNSRLAKAFLYPLNVGEVTLRNAIDELLVDRFGPRWHLDEHFRTRILTEDSCAVLDRAIQRAGADASRDQTVATLTFDFWSNLFRSDYGDLWRTSINVVFPELPRGQSRRDIQKLVRAINIFRNRVAHHEPILDLNVTEIYSQIVRLIELRCPQTALWVKHHSTIGAIIRTRPRLASSVGVTLRGRADPIFSTVDHATRLTTLLDRVEERHPVIVCADHDGRCCAAFTIFDLARFLRIRSDDASGLVDLNEHTVGELLGAFDLSEKWRAVPQDAPFAMATSELQKPRVQIVVAVDPSGAATGAILRAHRRY